MYHRANGSCIARVRAVLVLITACSALAAGCQEIDTLKREVLKKAQGQVLKKKNPFTPRDGITTRACSLYQTANPNSEVISKLPAETPVQLVDKIGEWFRIRTRDGREGFLEQKVVGGEEIIVKTTDLRHSIEGVPPQAEGVTKTKANFRLEPGRHHEIIEALPAGKKFEVYERVVTVRSANSTADKNPQGVRNVSAAQASEDASSGDETFDDGVKKDVWYKVKIEDGRVGYLHTQNMKLTPPEDIERAVPWMRLVAWRTINMADDPDRGAKNNYLVAYAPIGKDPGCDYTMVYLMTWSVKHKHRVITWKSPLAGILPITTYQYESKPGLTIRRLHPTRKDKLILTNFVLAQGTVKKVSEEEILNPSQLH